MVLGQAVTRGSTPKATLLEPTLFRRFFTSSLLTESYGESVASGVWVNEEDSNHGQMVENVEYWCYLPFTLLYFAREHPENTS